MGNELRIGGTLEISGVSAAVNQKRVDSILSSIPQYYKNLPIKNPETSEIWKGYRPLSFDGLPYIGQDDIVYNLFVGTGHGMMGLSLGAATGKLLSEMIAKKDHHVDYNPYRLRR